MPELLPKTKILDLLKQVPKDDSTRQLFRNIEQMVLKYFEMLNSPEKRRPPYSGPPPGARVVVQKSNQGKGYWKSFFEDKIDLDQIVPETFKYEGITIQLRALVKSYLEAIGRLEDSRA